MRHRTRPNRHALRTRKPARHNAARPRAELEPTKYPEPQVPLPRRTERPHIETDPASTTRREQCP